MLLTPILASSSAMPSSKIKKLSTLPRANSPSSLATLAPLPPCTRNTILRLIQKANSTAITQLTALAIITCAGVARLMVAAIHRRALPSMAVLGASINSTP